jgi:ABC-type dipeptide/oligopeptide/nickel transport system ATPase component
MKTKVINFVGGSGCGKSLMAALTFAELKMRHLKAEYVQEYAKTLVWQKRYEELDNQYQVSTEQYRMIKSVQNAVDYIVCDSGLIIGLFYNRYHPTNVCNVSKTEKMLKEKMAEFDNVYIYLERNDEFPYEREGRIQEEEEAKEIDTLFKSLLDELKLEYLSVVSSKESIPKILDYIQGLARPSDA